MRVRACAMIYTAGLPSLAGGGSVDDVAWCLLLDATFNVQAPKVEW